MASSQILAVADLGGGGGGSEPPSSLKFINSYCRLALTIEISLLLYIFFKKNAICSWTQTQPPPPPGLHKRSNPPLPRAASLQVPRACRFLMRHSSFTLQVLDPEPGCGLDSECGTENIFTHLRAHLMHPPPPPPFQILDISYRVMGSSESLHPSQLSVHVLQSKLLQSVQALHHSTNLSVVKLDVCSNKL